jgi:trehalose-phosphatase
MVGGTGLWAAGNHGFEFVSPQAGRQPHPAAAPFLPTIAATAAELRAALAGVEGVLVEDKALTISVHYRLVDPAAADEVRATAERIARAHGLRPSGGKLIVEIRPPVALDKGTAVIALAEELGDGSDDAAFLFAGDDVTDEDGFRRLRADHPRAVTVHVGSGHETAAEFTVPDVPAFRELLAALLASRAAPGTTEGAPH